MSDRKVRRRSVITAAGASALLGASAVLRRRKRRDQPVRRPIEVAPGVFCLETGSRFVPSNVYFVQSGSSWVLIDAGWSNCGRSIREAAESLFEADTRPAAILLTHLHPDHDGAALELSRVWNVQVYIHPDEMSLTAGTITAVEAYPAGPLDRWVILPVMRTMFRRWETMLARESLKDRARPFDPAAGPPGLPDWQCFPTPGHSPGHTSFFRPRDRVLISGDAAVTIKVNSLWGILFHQSGLSGPPWYTTSNWAVAKESIAALAALEPHVLAPGHGASMTGPETARKLQAFANHVWRVSQPSEVPS